MTHQDLRSSRQGLGSPFLLLLYPPGQLQPSKAPSPTSSPRQHEAHTNKGKKQSCSHVSASPFCQHQHLGSQARGHIRELVLMEKKNQIHRKAQPTFSGAEMEGGTPPALCSHTSCMPAAQMRARLFLSAAACEDVSSEQ